MRSGRLCRWLPGAPAPLVLGCLLTGSLLGCSTDGPGSGGPQAVAGAAGASTTGGAGSMPQGDGWQPLTACEPVLDQRVTRLSDRHISKGLAELLSIPAPAIETGALS